MRSLRLPALAAVAFSGVFGASAAMAGDIDRGLLARWSFDEGIGRFSAGAGEAAAEAELHNVHWVKGPFGTAVRFTGNESYVSLPPLPQLDGDDQMSLSVWVFWEGVGRYPNILTGGVWSPGGFLIFVSDRTCSFRMGRPGHRSGVLGEQWEETAAALLDPLPIGRWVHLSAVFRRPDIVTYVNGREVGRAKWDYPVGQRGEMQLGRWSGPVSHRGLIDELRIYRRALEPDEVRALADAAGRDTPNFEDLGPARSGVKEVARLQTQWVELSLGDDGTILSLREKNSGRELTAAPQPLLEVVCRSGERLRPRRLRREGDRYSIELLRHPGRAVLRISPKEHYFLVEAVDLQVDSAEQFTFFQIAPAPAEYVGSMAGAISDEQSGVCLRSLTLESDAAVRGNPLRLCAYTTAENGLVGGRAALAAGPRVHWIAMLQHMAQAEPVPRSRFGGPWAMEAAENRGSYLFADLAAKDTDAWIELARRGGFTHLHLHGWWKSLGHYEPNPAFFPGGMNELKAVADKLRAAGLRPSIHTLTACISPNDPWVTPVPSPHLMAVHRYTLASPISPLDTTIAVRQRPADDHDLVWSYSGRGNVLRIDSELIRYSGISREPPYAFLKCERGAFGTKAADHSADASVDYLRQEYFAFYPDPKSPLADQLAERIAAVYNQCGMEMIYFDGSEGMGGRYGIDAMRWKIFQRLNGGITEASCWGHNNWWFHSRLGAWDHAIWAVKRFHDKHIREAVRYRKAELLEPQLGWWAPRGPSEAARGQFPDELEYFAAKNLAIDAAMSIQGVDVSPRPWNARLEEMFTILGWYERLRLARCFDAETLQRIGEPGREFRLRLASDGKWKFTPVHSVAHRVRSAAADDRQWTFENPFGPQPLAGRIEALYAAADYDDPRGVVLADFADLNVWNNRRSAPEVKVQVELDTAEVKTGGRSLRLRALNRGTNARGAWAQVGAKFEHPYLKISPGRAMGLWIKGDGSGALLNVQLRTPREYLGCISEHYVDLNFTGWRYVELLLRERDADRFTDYRWPYSEGSGYHAIYRNTVDTDHVSEVNLFLNELPPGREVDILLSPIRALPLRTLELVDPSLAVPAGRIVFPVRLRSGQYLEWEDRSGAMYDQRGELVRRFQPEFVGEPRLASGRQEVSFDCGSSTPGECRAEVTIVSSGTPFGTPRFDEIDTKPLEREYELPRIITRFDGIENIWSIVCRAPIDRARPEPSPMLEVEIEASVLGMRPTGGPASVSEAFVDSPTLTIGDRRVQFAARIAPGGRLVCRDQVHWTVFDAKGEIVGQGKLSEPIPSLSGGETPVRLDVENISGDDLRVRCKLIKVYRRGE